MEVLEGCVFQSIKECRVAVIGAGKIGSAIIKALVAYGVPRVIATGRREETLRAAEKLGAEATRDNAWAAREADLIVLSVKPFHYPVVAPQIRGWVKGKPVASVMAGVRIATLRETLPGAEVYRAMPNINAIIRRSTTALAVDSNGERRYEALVEELFKTLGTVFKVPEEWLDIWTGLVGSGPAFIAEIVDAMVLGAVAAGMPRDVAYPAILDALKATAELLEKINQHPASIRDEVATPAGTTIRGLKVMESKGVKAALMETIEEAAKRSAELGEEIDRAVRRALAGKGLS